MTSNHPERDPRLAWREIDGEVIVISPHENLVHEMNPTASFIWKLADGKHSVEEIGGLLAHEFEVPPEVAIADAWEIIGLWREQSLVVEGHAHN